MNPRILSVICFAAALANAFLVFAAKSIVFSAFHFILALGCIYRASELKELSKQDDDDLDG